MCSPCHCTPTTFRIIYSTIGLTSILFNLVFNTDIGSLTITGIHEVPRPEVLRYKESLGPRAVSASGGITFDLTVFLQKRQLRGSQS